MQESARTPGSDTLLPLIAYYGTGRLWQQKKLTETKKIQRTSRTVGYTDCLDPASSYKSFVAWFRYWSLNAAEARIKAHEAGHGVIKTEFDDYLLSISRAVNTCIHPPVGQTSNIPSRAMLWWHTTSSLESFLSSCLVTVSAI
ncbi:hypothetical protein P4152_16375 [Pseudomonas aeruginosa]|nr:hypothetical protein [Pseudomonas aeruginosa]